MYKQSVSSVKSKYYKQTKGYFIIQIWDSVSKSFLVSKSNNWVHGDAIYGGKEDYGGVGLKHTHLLYLQGGDDSDKGAKI